MKNKLIKYDQLAAVIRNYPSSSIRPQISCTRKKLANISPNLADMLTTRMTYGYIWDEKGSIDDLK